MSKSQTRPITSGRTDIGEHRSARPCSPPQPRNLETAQRRLRWQSHLPLPAASRRDTAMTDGPLSPPPLAPHCPGACCCSFSSRLAGFGAVGPLFRCGRKPFDALGDASHADPLLYLPRHGAHHDRAAPGRSFYARMAQYRAMSRFCVRCSSLVELIGGISGGSQRWLNLGFMTPAAFRADEAWPSCWCCALVLFDAARRPDPQSWRLIWPAADAAGHSLRVLVMLQPDLAPALAIMFRRGGGHVPGWNPAAAPGSGSGRGSGRRSRRSPSSYLSARLSAQPRAHSSSIPKAIRSAPATTSLSPRSRSDRAG